MPEPGERRPGLAVRALLTLAWQRFRHTWGWKGPVSARLRSPTHGNRTKSSILIVFVGGLILLQSFFMSSRMIEGFAEKSLALGSERTAVDDRVFHRIEENADRWQTLSDEEIANELRLDLRIFPFSRDQEEQPPPEAEEIVTTFRQDGPEGFRNYEAFAKGWLSLGQFEEKPRTMMARLLGMIFLFLLVALLFMPLAVRQKDLAATNDHREWLFSLPLKEAELLIGSFLSSVLFRPLLYLILWPLLTNLLIANGSHFLTAALLSLVLSLLLSVMISAIELILDTWLRARAPAIILRNAQVIFSVAGLLSFYLVLAAGFVGSNSFVWVKWLALRLPGDLGQPMGHLLMGPTSLQLAWSLGAALLSGFGAFELGARFLRTGWLSGHGPQAPRKRAKKPLKKGGLLKFEALLLLRDRTLAVQVLIVPLCIAGYQVLINPLMVTNLTSRGIGAMVYGCGAYASLITAPQLLVSEARGLWLIYNLPVPIATYFRRRESLWRLAATGIAGLLMIILASISGAFAIDNGWRYGFALLGVWVVGRVISGVVMGQPRMPDVAAGEMPRIGLARMYGAMILAGIFGGLLWQGDPWSLATALILFWFLGEALWQRRNISFSYLLEPVEKESPSWGVDDGLWAILVFFVAQTGALLLWTGWDGDLGRPVLLSYLLGGVVALVFAEIKIRRKDLPLPPIADAHPKRNGKTLTRDTALATLICLTLGLVWTKILETGLLGEQAEGATEWSPLFLLALAGGAAPVIEELLFRGFMCRTMLGFWSPRKAIFSSALIFAAVHPGLSFPPVFLLGLATGWLYLRSHSVIPGMILHALYNLGIVGLALAA